jgi:hypothetical protein
MTNYRECREAVSVTKNACSTGGAEPQASKKTLVGKAGFGLHALLCSRGF